MSQADFGRAILLFVAFLFSICFHEFAHAWMAARKGDQTARLMGRLTLNPVAHADLIGTIVLPLMGLFGMAVFGWAKPVPVNPRNLKKPRSDMFWIAAAGPGSNLLLALAGSFGVALSYALQLQVPGVFKFLEGFIVINLLLCFFNLIPLHPLDGGKIIARFLPENVNQKLEEMQLYSGILLLVLFITGSLQFLMYPVQFTYVFMKGLAEGFIP